MNARLLILGLAALAACTTPPPPPPPPPAEARGFRISRAGLRALGDYVEAGYELRLVRDRAAAGQPVTAADAERAEARLGLARGQLRQALREDGADPARLASDDALLSVAHEGVKGNAAYAFFFPPDDDSFSIVRVTDDVAAREVTLFGAPFRYRLLAHDETVVDDYPAWRARRLSGVAVHRPATYRAEARDGRWSGVVRVDLAAVADIGERQWLPQVDALRDAARAAQQQDAFLALAERHAELLGLTRAALRWRSLEALWSLVGSRGKAEQLARFTEDYAARSELRAAAELREVARLRTPGDETPLSPEERARLFELGALSAMLHGEPLGVTADLLALAAASLAGGAPDEASALAARRLVVELAATVGERALGSQAGRPDAQADALRLFHLAGATPDALRAAAAALHRDRLRAIGGSGGD